MLCEFASTYTLDTESLQVSVFCKERSMPGVKAVRLKSYRCAIVLHDPRAAGLSAMWTMMASGERQGALFAASRGKLERNVRAQTLSGAFQAGIQSVKATSMRSGTRSADPSAQVAVCMASTHSYTR